jgi:hypothetical protein
MNPEFKCNRCGYATARKCNYKRHCMQASCGPLCADVPVEQFTKKEAQHKCEQCGKSYASPQSLSNHKHRCSQSTGAAHEEQPSPSSIHSTVINNNTTNNTTNNHTTNNVYNTIDNSTTINNVTNIVVLDFGNEQLDYVMDDPEFIRSCIKNASRGGFAKFVKHIHFHPAHKENHNVRLVSTKRNVSEVLRNQQWMRENTNAVLLEMMLRNHNRMDRAFDDVNIPKPNPTEDDELEGDIMVMKQCTRDMLNNLHSLSTTKNQRMFYDVCSQLKVLLENEFLRNKPL